MSMILILSMFVFFSRCDSDDKSAGYKGVLRVRVNTSADLWGYPQVGHTLATTSAEPDDGTWMYPAVGGDGDPVDEDNESAAVIASGDIGDKVNIVYVYSELGETSDATAVLYKGVGSVNNSVITINGMAPGNYYVVAFYDYAYGGNRTNLLNRYDRYSIYNGTTGTPFVDDTTQPVETVAVVESTPAEITLSIEANWVLGKPKLPGGGTGRYFLKTADGIPVP
jgi:hypothetical protein